MSEVLIHDAASLQNCTRTNRTGEFDWKEKNDGSLGHTRKCQSCQPFL